MWLILLLHLHLAASVFLPAPINVSITSFNMEHTLHFLPGPDTPPSSCFTVETIHLGRSQWIRVVGCSELTAGQTCNLSQVFKDLFSQYQVRVRAFISNETSQWTASGWFQPLTDTVVGPPGMSVSGCGNCLMLQLSLPTTWRRQQLISLHRELVVHVKRTWDGAQFRVSLPYDDDVIIKYLQPGVEYCVTITMTTLFNSNAVASGPQCAFTSRPQHATSLYVVCGLAAAFCFLAFLLVALVVCGSRLRLTLLKLHRTLVNFLLRTWDRVQVPPEFWGQTSSTRLHEGPSDCLHHSSWVASTTEEQL